MTYGSLYRAFAVYLVLSLAGSIALLSSKLRLLTGVERLQVQFVLLGIGVAAVGGSITNLVVPLVFRTSHLNIYGPILASSSSLRLPTRSFGIAFSIFAC